jgi:hypothetical protein
MRRDEAGRILPMMGSEHPMWNGGRITTCGYVRVHVGREHHLANNRGYAYEHRLVMEEKLGRRLRPGEIVHHIDRDGLNNNPDNLSLCADSTAHKVEHRSPACRRRLPNEANPTLRCSCGCSRTFLKYDKWGQPRRFYQYHRNGRREGIGRLRGPDEMNTAINCGCGCGRQLMRFDRRGRARQYIHGHHRRKPHD